MPQGDFGLATDFASVAAGVFGDCVPVVVMPAVAGFALVSSGFDLVVDGV